MSVFAPTEPGFTIPLSVNDLFWRFVVAIPYLLGCDNLARVRDSLKVVIEPQR